MARSPHPGQDRRSAARTRLPIFLKRSVADQSQVEPVEVVMTFAESLVGTMVRLGWAKSDGWRRARANANLSEVLLAMLRTHLRMGGRVRAGECACAIAIAD